MTASGSRGGAHVFKHTDFSMPTDMPADDGVVKEVEGSFLNLTQVDAEYEEYRKRNTFFAQTISEFKQAHKISHVIDIEKPW